MKKLLIAGGTGFLGQQVEKYFQRRECQVTILTRNPRATHHVRWDGKTRGDWTRTLEGADTLINLSGKSVDCRYTAANRTAILRSRIDSTKVLGEALAAAKNPPALWLNASSATIYVHAEQLRMTETDGIIGDDFSMSVCRTWEEAFFRTNLPRTRRVALRTSIVLGNEGGAYPKMKLITRLGLGGRQGSGRQWISWIHLSDFCRAVEHVIERTELAGAVNVTAPQPVRNHDFMRQLRQTLGIPGGVRQSVALLEIGAWLMRTETELLLKSRHVYPEALLATGFEFRFAKVEEAFAALAERPSSPEVYFATT